MLIMFSIFYDVAEKIGAKRRSSYSVFVLVFICGFSALAIGLVPYSGNLFVALSFMLAVDQRSPIQYLLFVLSTGR